MSARCIINLMRKAQRSVTEKVKAAMRPAYDQLKGLFKLVLYVKAISQKKRLLKTR